MWIQTEERNVKILSNLMVDINAQIEGIDAKELGVTEAVYYPVLAKILEENEDIEDIKQEIRRNISELIRFG